MNTVIQMHIDEFNEKILDSIKTLFKNKRITIKISDIPDDSENADLSINAEITSSKRKLSDFIGKVDWPLDGMDFQNSIRNEWK